MIKDDLMYSNLMANIIGNKEKPENEDTIGAFQVTVDFGDVVDFNEGSHFIVGTYFIVKDFEHDIDNDVITFRTLHNGKIEDLGVKPDKYTAQLDEENMLDYFDRLSKEKDDVWVKVILMGVRRIILAGKFEYKDNIVLSSNKYKHFDPLIIKTDNEEENKIISMRKPNKSE